MNKKPVILIAWGPCIDDQFYSHGMMLLRSYELAVKASGGIPMIPLDQTCAAEYAAFADGLLLPGAQSEYPEAGVSAKSRSESSNRRDSFCDDLFAAFYELKKPIMGICEGCQKINCCLGGSLKLDLAKEKGVAHWNTAHTIKTEKGSFVNDIWGDEPVVNSFHNFYVDEPGEGLKITSVSPQGNPETFEHESLPIYGFQFHPERMCGDECYPCDGADGKLVFDRFVKICGKQQ